MSDSDGTTSGEGSEEQPAGSDPGKQAPPARVEDNKPGEWLYAREIRHDVIRRTIAQIYLLIDNITATLSKQLPSIKGLTITTDAERDGTAPGRWLQRVCEVEWPPYGGSAPEEAKTAADLVQIRDALNQCAHPSSDMSIAFTLLVVGDLGTSGAPDLTIATAPAPSPTSGTLAPEFAVKPSRSELALLAFPQLRQRVKPARRRFFVFTPLILGVLLLVTTLLSFDAAQGTALLTQLTASQTRNDGLQDQLARLQKISTFRAARKAASTLPPVSAPPKPKIAPAPALSPASSPAPVAGPSEPAPDAAVVPTEAPDQQRLESQALSATSELSVAVSNLEAWAHANQWLAYESESLFVNRSNPAVPSYNIQRAAAVLGALISIVLPTLYGAIGATGGQVRDTYLRIKNNQLMPRHASLFVVPVLLGMISGATIGLFFAPSADAPSSAANVGAGLHLTASALAFLGGLGAEGMFDKFNEILQRLLGTRSDAPGPAATPHGK